MATPSLTRIFSRARASSSFSRRRSSMLRFRRRSSSCRLACPWQPTSREFLVGCNTHLFHEAMVFSGWCLQPSNNIVYTTCFHEPTVNAEKAVRARIPSAACAHTMRDGSVSPLVGPLQGLTLKKAHLQQLAPGADALLLAQPLHLPLLLLRSVGPPHVSLVHSIHIRHRLPCGYSRSDVCILNHTSWPDDSCARQHEASRLPGACGSTCRHEHSKRALIPAMLDHSDLSSMSISRSQAIGHLHADNHEPEAAPRGAPWPCAPCPRPACAPPPRSASAWAAAPAHHIAGD